MHLIAAGFTDSLLQFVQSHGILAVIILMAAESCGIWVPSEVIMPFAGFFAATGHFSVVGAGLAGAFGNLIGSLIAYLLAAQFGEPLLLGPGRYVGIKKSHVDMAEKWFRRHGWLAVLVGRDLPVIRTYISFPAGLARVPMLQFVVLTFVGSLPWCFALTYLGFAFGANYDKVSSPLQIAAIVIAALVAVAVVAWYLRGRRTANGATR